MCEVTGDVILSIREREAVTQRALGILPGDEEGRFRELLSAPWLSPRRITRSATQLLTAVSEIEAEFGTATALAYGLLCVAGLRDDAELIEYGRKLDQLFERLTTHACAQSVGWCEAGSPGAGFDQLLGPLLEVRRALWKLKPDRVSGDFLLTQVIDGHLGTKPGAGNSLGLALLDSIIIGKLGHTVDYLIEDGLLRLRVTVADRSVYWETVDPLPVAFVAVGKGKTLQRSELLALIYASLGTFCFAQGRWDKAIEVYRRALELESKSPETYVSLAACSLRKQDPGAAVRALKEALALSPQMAEAYYLQGNAYAMMQHWPRAVGAFKRAVELRHDYVEALNNLGLAYMNMGEPRCAQKAFEAAIESRPDYYQAHFNLGNLFLEQKQHDRALASYREACRHEPDFAPARYNMGRAYYEKHDLDSSISCYQKAVQINPRHFGAWHNLGIAYRDKGLIEKAVDALERAVTLNPCLMR